MANEVYSNVLVMFYTKTVITGTLKEYICIGKEH